MPSFACDAETADCSEQVKATIANDNGMRMEALRKCLHDKGENDPTVSVDAAAMKECRDALKKKIEQMQ